MLIPGCEDKILSMYCHWHDDEYRYWKSLYDFVLPFGQRR